MSRPAKQHASVRQLEEALRRWNGIKPVDLAKAIFSCVKGRADKLLAEPGNSNSVWGKIVKQMKLENKQLDRLWASAAYHSNKKEIKVIHQQLCSLRKEKYVGLADPKEDTLYCYCRNVETCDPSEHYPMLECDQCTQWYHFMCVGERQEDFQNDEEYKCPRCKNKNPKDIAPPIFLPLPEITTANRRSLSSKRNSANTTPLPHLTSPGRVLVLDRQDSLDRPPLEFRPSSSFGPLTRSLVVDDNQSKNILRTPSRHERTSPRSLFSKNTNEDQTTSKERINIEPGNPLTKSKVAVVGSFQEKPTKTFRFRRKTLPEPQPMSPIRRAISSPQSTVGISLLHHDNSTDQLGASSSKNISGNNGGHSTVGFQSASRFSPDADDIAQPDPIIEDLTTEPEGQLSDDEVSLEQENVPRNTNENLPIIAEADDSVEEELLTGTDQELEKSITQSGIEGPMEGFKPFQIIIPAEEYKKIAERAYFPNASDYRYRYRYDAKIWPHLFYSQFLHQCPPELKGCNVVFKSHRFTKSIFCILIGECNRKGTVSCQMKYTLEIIKEPLPDQDVPVRVVPSGVLHHDLTMIAKRQLTGIRRQEAQKELKTKSAGIYRRELYGKEETDKAALKKSNLTEVQTLKVLRNAKYEDARKQDLDPDISKDLKMRSDLMKQDPKLSGNHLKGFIQQLSEIPFNVTFYSERQLKLLKRYLKLNPAGVLHLDSTGKVTAKLPDSMGTTQSFYYAVVLQLPGSIESPCVPILEFVSNEHTTTNITAVLHHYFRKYGEKFGTEELAFGIKRMETDCSRTLISAVLQAFEIGRTDRYLKDAWYHLTRKKPIYYIHHICRTHAIRFTNDRIETHFKPADQSTIRVWRDQLLFGKSLEDFCRRVRDIGMICGMKYNSPEVMEAIGNLKEPTIINDSKPWSSTHLDDLPSRASFYAMSPFGNYALHLFYDLKIPLSTSMYASIGKTLEPHDEEHDDMAYADYYENPTYSIKFLEYLIVNVFSLGCLFDHSLITLNSFSPDVDTNATSEAWNKLLKKDEMAHGLGIKIGRFISFSEELLRGRLEMFENGLLRMERHKGTATGRALTRQKVLPGLEDDAEDNPESSQEHWSGKKTPSQKRHIACPSFVSTLCIDSPFYCDTLLGAMDINTFINFTCPLQILYTLYKCKINVKDYLNGPINEQSPISRLILDVINTIDTRDFKNAKTICLKNIMRKDPLDLSPQDFFYGDLQFISAISEAFPLYQITDCGKNCLMSRSRKVFPFRDYVVSSNESLVKFLSPVCKPTCTVCSKKNSVTQFRWAATGPLPILAYPVDLTHCELKLADVPSSIRAVGSLFSLFAFTIFSNGVFSSIFVHGGKKYIHQPGKTVGQITKLPDNYKICSLWYLSNESVEV